MHQISQVEQECVILLNSIEKPEIGSIALQKVIEENLEGKIKQVWIRSKLFPPVCVALQMPH